MCVYVICRPVVNVSRQNFRKICTIRSMRFFLTGTSSYFFDSSIRHWAFSTSLTTHENERTICQGTRVRSHGVMFLSIIGDYSKLIFHESNETERSSSFFLTSDFNEKNQQRNFAIVRGRLKLA